MTNIIIDIIPIILSVLALVVSLLTYLDRIEVDKLSKDRGEINDLLIKCYGPLLQKIRNIEVKAHYFPSPVIGLQGGRTKSIGPNIPSEDYIALPGGVSREIDTIITNYEHNIREVTKEEDKTDLIGRLRFIIENSETKNQETQFHPKRMIEKLPEWIPDLKKETLEAILKELVNACEILRSRVQDELEENNELIRSRNRRFYHMIKFW